MEYQAYSNFMRDIPGELPLLNVGGVVTDPVIPISGCCHTAIAIMMSKYGSLNLSKIRTELRNRGARISGRKTELIERLEAYDRNKDFGREILEKEFAMTLPSPTLYKDINADTIFSPIKYEAVQFYLNQVDKAMDDDAKNLYQNRFLKFARLCVKDDLFFVKSECHAQMKKHISYQVDVSFDRDGCIFNCQCECAAGMGPTAHCKHVCAVLFGLLQFSLHKEFLTEETCTQRLQTFHTSKPFHGSPIKSSSLAMTKELFNVNFDPRPEGYRNVLGYSSYFRSVWLNHPNINQFPISHLYKPANPYALDLDHDYCQLKLSDKFLKDSNITSISSKEIAEIECQTRGQSNNKLWFLERCFRLHSSKFGRIVKATSRTDLKKLAHSLVHAPNFTVNAAPLLHGRKYECKALEVFEKQCGVVTKKCGIFVCKTNPFLAASPDALLGDETVVEIKCPFNARTLNIEPSTVPYLTYDMQLDREHDYFYQIQGQMLCTDRKECILVIYTFEDVKYIKVPRDNPFIENMVQRLESFFENYFKQAVLERFFFKNYNNYTF